MHGLIFTSFRAFVASEYPAISDQVWERERKYLATDAYTDVEFEAVLAAPPQLDVRALSGGGVSITYTSPRGLCELLEGLVVGIARYYGNAIRIDQPLCMRRGDVDGCTFFVTPA